LEDIKNELASVKINEIEYDMSSCDFISSAGIGILVNTTRQAKEKGHKTKMANYNDSIENILKITDILGYIGTE
jgi:anti-anti-sigma factor